MTTRGWCSELAPLERLTWKQPRHISRALTRDTVCKKTSGEDARGLRRNLYLYVYMISCTCTHVKSPPTWHACLRADTLGIKHKNFLFNLNRRQCLFLSSFPNAPCFLLFCFRLFYAYELVEDDVVRKL